MFLSLFFTIILLHSFQFDRRSVVDPDLERKLDTTLENYQLSAPTFVEALATLASRFDIPMGIEWIKEPSSMRPISLEWKRGSIREMIATVVNNQGHYALDTNNGVVHVFPNRSLRDPHDFLNVRIESFQVQNEFIAWAAYELRKAVAQMIQGPERKSVRDKGSPSPSPGTGRGGSITAGLGDKRVTLSLAKKQVRDILDAFAQASDLKVWIVTYPAEESMTKEGFRRTAALHTNSTIPDEQQPEWTFLPWGQRVQVK